MNDLWLEPMRVSPSQGLPEVEIPELVYWAHDWIQVPSIGTLTALESKKLMKKLAKYAVRKRALERLF